MGYFLQPIPYTFYGALYGTISGVYITLGITTTMNKPTNLAEVLTYIAKQEQERVANQLAEAQQKILTTSYDKAAAYTTVIVFGGYAGFFALWQLSKEYLAKEQALWSALLILVSMLSFVLFEVLKMVLVTRSVLKQAAALRNPNIKRDPQRLLAALAAIEQSQSAALKPFMVAWAVTVAIALLGALGGAGILAYAFIHGLAA